MRVAIVALGPSYLDYIRIAEGIGNRGILFDEIWVINGFGYVLQCDRMFHMDDVRIQQIRADGGNRKVGAQLEWMKKHPGPIYTSRVHPDYSGLVEYPLEAVLNTVKRPYINSTVAHAICLFIHEAAQRQEQGTGEREELTLFGVDFTYPDMRAAEEGRACVEFWLGVAQQRGIHIAAPGSSTLLDACKPAAIYGYDGVNITLKKDKDGHITLDIAEKEMLPSAAEIEAIYNHATDDGGKRISVEEREALRREAHAGENGAGSADKGQDKAGRRKRRGSGNGAAMAQKPAEAVHVEAG